jgi:hypothetical protein
MEITSPQMDITSQMLFFSLSKGECNTTGGDHQSTDGHHQSVVLLVHHLDPVALATELPDDTILVRPHWLV